jgi:hypothetical protein
MVLLVSTGFGHFYAFAFEEFLLQRSVRLANEEFATGADYAVPGDAPSRGSGGHGPAGTACAAAQAQSSSEGSIR